MVVCKPAVVFSCYSPQIIVTYLRLSVLLSAYLCELYLISLCLKFFSTLAAFYEPEISTANFN